MVGVCLTMSAYTYNVLKYIIGVLIIISHIFSNHSMSLVHSTWSLENKNTDRGLDFHRADHDTIALAICHLTK